MNARRFTAIAVLAGAALYMFYVTRSFIAGHYAARLNVDALDRAIRFEPSNPEYYYLAGQYSLLSGRAYPVAIERFREAIRLDPYDSRYYLALAETYMLEGDMSAQEEALRQAMHANPTDPGLAWEAATVYLTSGDLDAAMPLFSLAMKYDPSKVDSALLTLMRATGGDYKQIFDHAVPPDPEIYAAFLRILIHARNSAGADFLWSKILALHGPLDRKTAILYVDYLIAQKRASDSLAAWKYTVALHPGLKPYSPGDLDQSSTGQNLVANGGFDYPNINAAFDWRYSSVSGVSLSFDSTELRNGTQSLAIRFDSVPVGDIGLLQYIPLPPSKCYAFSAYAKSNELEGVGGPRFAVIDWNSGKQLLLTNDVTGTTPWHEIDGTFLTSPETNWILLKIVHEPNYTMVKGTAWFDDVSISQTSDSACAVSPAHGQS